MSKITNNKPPLVLRSLDALPPYRHDFSTYTKKKNTVFILSTGRTGTTFLADYLSTFDNVFATHEPRPTYRLRLWSNARLEEKVDDKYLKDTFLKYRANKINSVNEHTYIESNPFICGFAKAIPLIYPDAKIVHIIRNPRDYIESAINHGALRGGKQILNRYMPYWTYGHRSRKSAENSNIVRRMAEFWVKANTLLVNSGKNNKNYLLIRFEDLFSKEEEITKLVSFIGLKDNKSNNTKRFLDKNTSKFRDAKVMREWDDEITKTCGDLMSYFGYKDSSKKNSQ